MTGHKITSSSDGLVRSHAAKAIAAGLKAAGYDAKPVDNGYAVKIFDADKHQICIVWLPLGEPTPTGLGDKYLWGRTGDEYQAPDFTGMTDLVRSIARTLQ